MTTALAFEIAAAVPVAAPGAQTPAPLCRPRLLVRAARAGQAGWRRERDLRRLLGSADLPGPATVLRLLGAEEAFLDAARRAGAASYAPERHVAVLIALLAELRRAADLSARGTNRPAHP